MRKIIFGLLFTLCLPSIHGQQKAFFKAAKKGDIEKIRLLITNGVDINLIDTTTKQDPANALQISVKNGHLDLSEYLISKGADINLKNQTGYTALDYACIYQGIDLIKLLVENGAEIDHQNDYGITPLMSVSVRDYIATKYLISKGADVNYISKPTIDTWKTTALIYAAPYCNQNIIQILIENCDIINYKDNYGRTALDYAKRIEKTCPGNIEILMQFGAKTGDEIE
jgi:ankyrin repeat protein